MIDWTKQIRRSDNREPLHYIGIGANGNPVFQERVRRNGKQPLWWFALGRVQNHGGHADWSVENTPEPKVGYVNIYKDTTGRLYQSRERADACASKDRIACVRVEYTDGQYDT